MKYAVLSSGSKGNCTIVIGKKHVIMIDCGLTKKTLVDKLSQCGLGIEDISLLLITHGHSDHVKGIRFIPQDKWITSLYVINEDLDKSQYLFAFESFDFDEFSIKSFPLSHDATNTCGFSITEGKETLTYVTDTGYLPTKVMNMIKDSTYYVFESNHDVKMLYESSRPSYLIKRIASDKGHLDNVASSYYLSNLIGKDTKEITLAHLSEECNTPSIALDTYKKVMLAQFGKEPNILVRCASIENVVFGGDKNED